MPNDWEEVPIVTPSGVRARHHGYTLRNGAKCIIIEDPDARVPAAAMSIRAGQLSDPASIPGLAHLCEHMLFKGTAKYPREDEYDSYITQHGGYSDAWTADCSTVYSFTVAADALLGALERFLEFFVAPSFNPNALAREILIVHSEDEKGHSGDYWRIDELERTMFSPSHPRSQYGGGNLTTLRDGPAAAGIDVHKELVRFFSERYVAGAACLAVRSALPPSVVLQAVTPVLLRMRDGQPPPFHFPSGDDSVPSLLASGAMRSWANVRTVRPKRSLRVLWPVVSPLANWRAMPEGYASHIVGHECSTSVIGVLREKNLATELFAGRYRIDDDHDMVIFEISLTADGLRNVVDVLDILYEGIGLASRVDAAAYADMKAEKRLAFESSDLGEASSHCVSLADNANVADLRHCWVAGDLILEDDIPAAEAYAAQLTPDRAVVMLLWSDMPCAGDAAGDADPNPAEKKKNTQTEEAATATALFASLPDFAQVRCDRVMPFQFAQYALCTVPDKFVARWAARRASPICHGLALPPPNPFLATDLARHEVTPGVVTARGAYGVALSRPFATASGTFRSSIDWHSFSPVAAATPLGRFYAMVMRGILLDYLAELSYFGALAGINNTISLQRGGLGIAVAGPQERLAAFFFSLLERVFTPSILVASEVKYTNYAESVCRLFRGQAGKQPYKLAGLCFAKAARVLEFTFDEILQAAAGASYALYQEFVWDYVSAGVYYECFVTGNIPSAGYAGEVIMRQADATLQRLGVPPAERSRLAPTRDAFAFSPTRPPNPVEPCIDLLSFPPFLSSNNNVAVLFDVYLGEETPQLRASCDCLHKLLSSRFFNALRTRESLGYIVFLRSIRYYGAAHMQFIVQSAVPGVDGLYLLSRIIAFLAAVEQCLETVCAEAKVTRVAHSLAELRRKVADSAEEDAEDLAIRHSHPFGFGHKEAEIDALERIDAAAVRALFSESVANSSPARRALAVVVRGNQCAEGDDALNFDRHGDWRVLQLPPQRPAEAPQGETEELGDSDGDDESEQVGADEDVPDLTLPDFEAETMCIAVRSHPSPEAYSRGFPVLPGASFER